ncbi:MAG: alpha/beta hydrolase [Gammaproteobacteria bacterium]|nr:alpha/beta hydrolase [Gammaproteobacteria bacterium]MCF6260919.1 alpha/beta hydrolase [Gammaproteobacteria bacterium]
MIIRWRISVVLLLALLSCACTTPTMRNDAFAAASGFTRQVVPGAGFSHLIYIAENGAKNRTETRKDNVWHIYIEGDGVPWVRRQIIAADPTPSEPLMLQLMVQDSHPAIYLGRPCYFGMARDSACNPWVWTHGRYSEQVVESMRAALATLINANTITSLVLIGHSGGGTLAMLLAERIPQVRLVVTLAGNLDIDAWTARHGYTALAHSLNPARRPPLPRYIDQLHYVGKNDKNISPKILEAAIKQQNARMLVLDDVGHQQGWDNYWTKILQTIDFLRGSYE